MPKLVEVPDVGEVEFPDEMNDDQIVEAIRGFTAAPQEPPVSDVEIPAAPPQEAAPSEQLWGGIRGDPSVLASQPRPSPDIPGSGVIRGGILGSTPPPPPEQFDPNNPEHARAALQSQAALETFNTMMLPFRADWFDASTDEERARAAGQAEVDKLETRRALDSFTPEQRNPSHPDYESAVGAARAYTAAKDRSDALNARIASVQPGAVAEREAAEKAQATEQQRREFMGETNPFIALLSQAASYPLNVVGGALQDVSPTLGSELMRGGQQFKETASRAPGATGAIARGVGDVGGLMLGGPSGAIKASISATVRGAQDAYAQTLLATGSEEQADQARLKAARDMLAYMAVGTGASRAVQAALPAGTAPFRAAVLSGTGAAGANVATSFGMAAARGEEYGLQQLTADIVMGGVEGVQTGKRVKAEQPEVPPKPSIEQPLISELVRPPSETTTTPSETTTTPSETTTTPSETTAVEKISREEAEAQGPQAISSIMEKYGVDRDTAAQMQSSARQEFGISREVGIAQNPIEQIASENGVKYDGPTELPGNPHQFTDQRTGSTFIVLGEPTAEKVQAKVDKIDQNYGLPPRERRLGPGAANIEEPLAEGFPTSNKEEVVNEERAVQWKDPIVKEASIGNEEAFARARQILEQNPTRGLEIAQRLNTEGAHERTISFEDAAIMLAERVRVKKARGAEVEKSIDPNLSPEERAAARQRAEEMSAQLETLDSAAQGARSTWGRFGQFWQRSVNEDFTFVEMVNRERLRKGEELTEAETQEIKTDADKYQEAQQKVEEAEVGQPIDDAIRAIEAEASKDPEFTPEVRSLADRIVARLERASKGASERIRGLMSQLGGQLSVGADVVTGAKLVKELALKAAADIGRLGLKSTLKFTRWATNMVKEFGEGIKPYLKDAWDQADKDIDAAVAGTRTKKPKEVKAAVTKENVGAAVEQLGTAIKSKGGKLSEMRSDIQKLVETLVRGGIKQREPLVDAVHEVLKGVDPSITRRQTADLISGYGDFKQLNPDAVKAEVRDLKQQLQLASKIEDVLGSVPLKRSGIERQPLSDEGRALTKKLNELSRELGIKITDPATQLKSILGALETRLTNRIKDLKAEIAKGQRTVKTKTPTPTNAKIEGLRAELEQVQAQHEAVFGKETRKMTDEQKIRIYKTRTQNRIKELEDRMARGDFETAPRQKLDVSKDPEAVKAQTTLREIRTKYERKKAVADAAKEWAERNIAQKIGYGIKRGWQAIRNFALSFDLTATIQSAMAMASHPIEGARAIGIGARTFVEGLFRKQNNFAKRLEAQIELDPLYKDGTYKRMGLDIRLGEARDENMSSVLEQLADLETNWGGVPDVVKGLMNMRGKQIASGSNQLLKTPLKVVGRGLRASNEAFQAIVNTMRVVTARSIMKKEFSSSAPTDAQLKLLGNHINAATGSGGIKRSEGARAILFAPNWYLSVLKSLSGQPFWKAAYQGQGKAARIIATDYVRALGTLAVLLGARQLFFGDDRRNRLRSNELLDPNAGTITLPSGVTIDLTQGRAQWLSLGARMLAGGKREGGGRFEKQDPTQALLSFFKGRLSREIATGLKLVSQKDYDGKPLDPAKFAQSIVTPLSWKDLGPIIKKEGYTKGSFLQLMNFVFGNVKANERQGRR